MPHLSRPGWVVAGRFHQEPADSLRRPTFFGLSVTSLLTRLLPAAAVVAVLLGSLLSPVRGLQGSLTSGYGCGYGYGTPPTVTGVSPRFGPNTGGTTVTITGSCFTGATGVDFGGTPATTFTVDSDSQITATSPA